jgi:nucleotide-binding universal stress UspA family protein
MLPIHTILFPTDFSEHAQAVFPWACSLARDCGARIIVLHVMPPPLGDEQMQARHHPEEYYGPARNALHQIHAPEDNVRVEQRLEEGDPAKVIANLAKETKAGLIIMGTHGRTGLGRVLLGSVTEQVLRAAQCPVLTVKTPVLQTTSETKPHLLKQ